jgi:hypothetical protein
LLTRRLRRSPLPAPGGFPANRQEAKPMNVRAKFFVNEIKHCGTPGSDPYATIVMTPVFGTYGDGSDNETWSKATPSGKLEMAVTNPAAIDAFEIGKAYLIEFTPAD